MMKLLKNRKFKADSLRKINGLRVQAFHCLKVKFPTKGFFRKCDQTFVHCKRKIFERSQEDRRGVGFSNKAFLGLQFFLLVECERGRYLPGISQTCCNRVKQTLDRFSLRAPL